jgi:hypothetical protein
LAAFSPDVTSDLYPWTLLRALLTEVGTTETSGKPCIPAAVSKFSNPKKPDLLVEEPERHRKSEKEEVLPMASTRAGNAKTKDGFWKTGGCSTETTK